MPHKQALSEDNIRLILTTEISHGVLAKRLGVHRSTISQIRLGRIYANVLPDLPRWRPALSCGQCIHWREACTLGFPDPSIEGVGFARDCNTFLHRP